MQIRLNNARLAFPTLWEPEQVQGQGKAAYSAQLLIARDDPQVKTLEALITSVAQATWGVKAADVLKQLKAKDSICVHSGDLKADYVGYAGNLYISARSEARPLIIDGARRILSASDGKPYAGCYVNAVLDIWAQDNKFGRRVNAGLKGLQFAADGDAFSGSAPAKVDDFDALEVAADEAVF
jgi:hypothetical protein